MPRQSEARRREEKKKVRDEARIGHLSSKKPRTVKTMIRRCRTKNDFAGGRSCRRRRQRSMEKNWETFVVIAEHQPFSRLKRYIYESCRTCRTLKLPLISIRYARKIFIPRQPKVFHAVHVPMVMHENVSGENNQRILLILGVGC